MTEEIKISKSCISDANSEYDTQISLLQEVLDWHAPQKMRIIRGTQAPFMNKDLSKAIMKRSQL